MGKERQALPILDRKNHQDWLRCIRIAIDSKHVAIAIQFTKNEYARIAREGGAINATPTGSTTAAFRNGSSSWKLVSVKQCTLRFRIQTCIEVTSQVPQINNQDEDPLRTRGR